MFSSNVAWLGKWVHGIQHMNHRSIWLLYSTPTILHQYYVQKEEGLNAFCQNIRIYRRKARWDIKLEKDNFGETTSSWGVIKSAILKLFSTVHHAKMIRYAKGSEIDWGVGRPVKDRWRAVWSRIKNIIGDFVCMRGSADFWIGRDWTGPRWGGSASED